MAHLTAFIENNKYGFKNDDGEIIVSPKYDKVSFSFGLDSNSQCQYCSVCLNKKWGIINEKGTMVVPAEYDSQFEMYSQSRILSSRNGKWGFVSVFGYDSIPFKYDLVEKRYDGDFDVKIDNKWGVLCLDGREKVAVKYANRIPTKYEDIIVQDYNTKLFGVLSKEGTEIIPTIYEHLLKNNKYFYFGHGGFEWNNFFSSYCDANWGCMLKDGTEIIPPKYDCFIANEMNSNCYLTDVINDNYILAGRNGCFVGEHNEHYTGIYDLYTTSGELLFGGFDKTKVIDGNYLFLLNGHWEEYLLYQDDWNNQTIYDFRLDTKQAKWLALDKNLLSINLSKEGKKVQFPKGFIATINKEKKDSIVSTFDTFDESLLLDNEPKFIGGYMIVFNNDKSHAIRISDGESTASFNEIIPINPYDLINATPNQETGLYDESLLVNDELFFVRNDNKIGIVSFKNTLYLPLNYFAITYPVNGYMFAFKELQDANCSVDFIQIEGEKVPIKNAIATKPKNRVIAEIKSGMYYIIHKDEKKGLKAISVYRPSIFDDSFASLINSESHGVLYDKYYYNYYYHNYSQNNYWFSNDLDLQEQNNNYDTVVEDDDWNSERETWYGMTDGMYGDMPEDFDGDYSFLGY